MLAQQMESVFLRPSSVASRRFRRTTGGYDPEEVHQFLEDVADYLSRLEGELEWRRARRTRRTGTAGEQREAISVVTEARELAERILAEARKEAEGFMRLARAIAHQLALEAQARRPHVALAVTRASGSSTTVEGLQDFDDMEVWIDASVFDLTKVEEPEVPSDVPATNDATPDVSSPDDSAESNAAASDEGKKPQDLVATSDDSSTSDGVAPSDESSASVSAADSNQATTTGKSKKKSKRRAKKKF